MTKKLILCHTLDIERYMLVRNSSAFEYFDFNSKVEAKSLPQQIPSTLGVELVQEKQHKFVIQASGVLNVLCLFIWVDLTLTARIPVDEGQEKSYRFPFGDKKLKLRQYQIPQENTTPNYITSFYHRSSEVYASNWMNPIILLPDPQEVKTGDVVRVSTLSKLDSFSPSYSFSIRVTRKENTIYAREVLLSYADLYPDFEPLNTQ